MKYYTADLHIGHGNIIRFCNRPFLTVDQMNKKLIENWNSVVTDKDDVYIIGDMFYRLIEELSVYLRKLKGRKHLIMGNHDKWIKKAGNKEYFETVTDYLDINDDGMRVVLFHYPILEWNAINRGSYHVYGHIHNHRGNTFEVLKNMDKALNAGVYINGFIPVNIQQLIVNNMQFKKESID